MELLRISNAVSIPLHEVELRAVRAQGPGGQNVNKVATAVHLRFDVQASSLPDFYKTRLLNLKSRLLTTEGVVVLKAQKFRTQERNRAEALRRLVELIQSVAVTRKKRTATRPTRASREARLESKRKRGEIKSRRRNIPDSGE